MKSNRVKLRMVAKIQLALGIYIIVCVISLHVYLIYRLISYLAT